MLAAGKFGIFTVCLKAGQARHHDHHGAARLNVRRGGQHHPRPLLPPAAGQHICSGPQFQRRNLLSKVSVAHCSVRFRDCYRKLILACGADCVLLHDADPGNAVLAEGGEDVPRGGGGGPGRGQSAVQ